MNITQKPIADLDNLPEEKREQLHAWLEEFGYHKVMEMLRTEWQLEITYNKLYRYKQRVLQLRAFDGIAEDRMTITHFLALQNGDPVPYDEAGIAVIQKRAFELACEPKTTPTRLNSLLRICHYKKQLEFTERRIDISDRAVKVREAQLADRRASAAQKAAQSTSLDKPILTTAPSILVPPNAPTPARTAKLGDHTIDLDALSERARKHFNVPEDEWKARRARSREAREKRLQAEKDQAEREKSEKEKSAETKTRSADGAELTPMIPATQNSGRDDFHVVPDISPNTPPIQSIQQNSGITPNICNSGSTQNSELKTQTSPMHSHTIRRCRSYVHGLPAELRDDSWISECPCGATLPCRQHIDLARELRYVNPINNDYAAALARHGLSFHVPTPEELNPAASTHH